VSTKQLILTRDGRTRNPEVVGKWCKPVRLHVAARGPRFPTNLSNEGLPLFCRVLLHSVGEGKGHASQGIERVRSSADKLEFWTDCGSILLRSGGELQLNGGAGRWTVDVWVEEEITHEPEERWLTGYYNVERHLSDWPPCATHFRLLQGSASLDGTTLNPGLVFPIAMIGSTANVSVQGWFQIGALLP